MNIAVMAVGFVGVSISLLLLYLTTGVLLHFVTFDRETVDHYMEALRADSSFEGLMAGVTAYGFSMGIAGVLGLLYPAYAHWAAAAAYTFLLLGLLYFLYRMLTLTAIS